MIKEYILEILRTNNKVILMKKLIFKYNLSPFLDYTYIYIYVLYLFIREFTVIINIIYMYSEYLKK